MIFRINLAMLRGRIWDSPHVRSFSVSSFACCPSCCPRLCEVNPGFPDAMQLIVGARLGFERLSFEQEVRPPVVSAILLWLLRIRARG